MNPNICPCPKSPSFVGFYIPAPWFAYGTSCIHIPYSWNDKIETGAETTNTLLVWLLLVILSYSCYSIGMSRGDLTVNCVLYMLTSQGSSLRFQSTQNRDTTDFHTPPRRFVRTQSPSITVLFRCLFGCGKWQWGIPYRFDDIRAK